MSLRHRLPATLPQEAAFGLSIAFGVFSLGVWGLLGLGWHLGSGRALHGPHAAVLTPVASAAPPAPQVAAATPTPAAQLAGTVTVAPGSRKAAPMPLANPADRPLEEAAQPAPDPATVTGLDLPPVHRVPHSRSLLLPAGGTAPVAALPRAAAPVAQAHSAVDRPVQMPVAQVAAAKVPAAKAAVAEAPLVSAPLVASATQFPVAAPVIHPRYVAIRIGRRKLWVRAGGTEPALYGRVGADAPGRDLAAAEPAGVPRRTSPLVLRRMRAVALAALETAPEAATLSPGAQSEMAASRLAEQGHEMPAARQTALAPARLAAARSLAVDPARPAHRRAIEQAPMREPAEGSDALAAAPAARLARPRLRRPLPAAAAIALRERLARHGLTPAVVASRLVRRPAAVKFAARPLPIEHALPAQPTTSGVTFHTVFVGGASSHGVPAGNARLGAPVYDASAHTLRVPLVGHLPSGQLHVYRLDNGRAYVDVPGAQPGSVRTRLLSTPDGTFRRGAIAGRPSLHGTRLSFDLPAKAGLSASVEGDVLVLRAAPR